MAKRRIVVALRRTSPIARLFAVAQDLCGRMGDEIEVLVDAGHPQLVQIQQEASLLEVQGHQVRLLLIPRLNAGQVVDHANRHPCIVAVVVGRPHAWSESGDPWARLDCPLIAAVEPAPTTPSESESGPQREPG